MDGLNSMPQLVSIPLLQWFGFTYIYPTYKVVSVTQTLFRGIN